MYKASPPNAIGVLTRRYIKHLKLTFILEMFSIILVYSVVVVVLFFMNGLQKSQLDAIKEVSSFPLIINNIDKTTAEDIKQSLLSSGLVDNAYMYTDKNVYLSKGDTYSVYVLRMVEASYFESETFKKHFVYFPSFHKNNNAYALPSSLYYKGSNASLLALESGESGGITINKMELKTTEPYYEKSYISTPEIIFKVIGDDANVSLGVYTSEKNIKKVKTLAQNLCEDCTFSSYKEQKADVYSALVIERLFLSFSLFILVLLLFLSFKKTMNSMIDENESEFIILKVYGISNSELKRIFFLSLYIPIVISIAIGVLLGEALVKTSVLSSLVSVLFSSNVVNFTFIPNYKALSIFVCLSLIPPFSLILSSAKRLKYCSITKEKDDE